jgi:hypothetical protein
MRVASGLALELTLIGSAPPAHRDQGSAARTLVVLLITA